MDTEEKLLALKKAYADIILNISKEAAARVMASDRKAAQYQHDLRMAKEEGLRMLVRLKRMMDTKMGEAEAASLYQNNKTEELEAQLHEAEDIVSDLREELRGVQCQLERVKNENFQPENEPENFSPKELPVESQVYSYQSSTIFLPKSQHEFTVASDTTMPYPQQKNKCDKCFNKVVCLCASNIGNRDLPNIILRGKAPKFYRNGCTQRIHACERNVLDKKLGVSGKTAIAKDRKNCADLEECQDTCQAQTSGAKSLRHHKKKLSGVKPRNFESFVQKRKRTYRRKKVITPVFGPQPLRCPETVQLPELPVITDPVSVKDTTDLCDNFYKIPPNLSTYKDEPQIESEYAESSEKATNLVEVGDVKNVQKDEESIEDVVLSRKATAFAKTSLSSGCEMDVESANIPFSNSEIKTSDTSKSFPTQPKRERVIRYTFQRKRKRLCWSDSDAKVSLGTEKVEPPRCSLLKESSRDSRRLAQVARQLISLSEKEWCE